MSLRQVLLVYLDSGAAAGYDIVKGFQRTYGYLWNASYQQIYRDLGKLLEDGLVDCETKANGRRPARKVYRINPRGRAAMHQWLATPVRLPHVNDAFLVKLAAVHLLDRDAFIAELHEHQKAYRAVLVDLRRNLAFFDALPRAFLQRKAYGIYLTLKRGIQVVDTWLEWAEEVEAFLLNVPLEAPTQEEVAMFNRLLMSDQVPL
ncbi:MAG: PadR family transcriptional regulator [Moraxellaceae bacterium]|nr:PadR family transcriptional regulator [Moraxellaceae bacterium]